MVKKYILKKRNNKTMLHYLLAFIIFIHSLLHLMGYSKAFQYTGIKHIEAHISRPIGILWIMSCFFFTGAGVLFLLNNDYWQIVGVVSIALSQIAIIIGWKNARYGTIVNLLILTAIVISKYSDLFQK
jgi:hypothetical protein